MDEHTFDAGAQQVPADPMGRSADQLLDEATARRAHGRLQEACLLAYMALGAPSVDESAAHALQARIHLLLSQLHGVLGRRGVERIHASKAYAEARRSHVSATSIDMTAYLTRLAEVSAHIGDLAVAERLFAWVLDEQQRHGQAEQQARTRLRIAELSLQRLGSGYHPLETWQSACVAASAAVAQALSVLDAEPSTSLRVDIAGLQAEVAMRISDHVADDERTQFMLASTLQRCLRRWRCARGPVTIARVRSSTRLANSRRFLVRLGSYRLARKTIESSFALQESLQHINVSLAARHGTRCHA